MNIKIAGNWVDKPLKYKSGGVWSTKSVALVGTTTPVAVNAVIDTAPSGTTSDPTPTFTFHSTGGNGVVHRIFSIDQGTPSWGYLPDGSTSYTPQNNLADGTWTFRLQVVDEAGNTDPSPPTATFTVDAVTAAPDTVIDGGPTGTTTDNTPTFSFHAVGTSTHLQTSIDTGTPTWTNRTSPYTPAALANGSYTFRVRAADGFNVDPTPATRAFTVAVPTSNPGAPPFDPVSTITPGTPTITSAAQWRTQANTASNAGKTLGVAAGTYALDLRGSGGHPPTMFGPASGVVTFVPTGAARSVIVSGIDYQYTRNIRMEGVKFTGQVDIVGASDFSVPQPWDPGAAYRNQYLQFYGCEFTGGAHKGLYVQIWSDHVLVEGCWFHGLLCPDTGDDSPGYNIQASGAQGQNKDLQIKSNLFELAHNDVIQCSSYDGILIDRNEFDSCQRTNFGGGDPSKGSHIDAIQFFGTANVTVTNNYVHDWTIEQIQFNEIGWGGVCKVQNNLFRDTTTKAFWWKTATDGWQFVASGSILVDHNTTRSTGGCYIATPYGTKAFTVTNNNFDSLQIDYPANVIASQSGNVSGGSFNADQESTTYPGKGYVKPTGVWW